MQSTTYTTGKIPDSYKKSIMVIQGGSNMTRTDVARFTHKQSRSYLNHLVLPKKSKSTKCEEYRTLSILTHTSKILTKIILGQIEKKIDENLAEDQFGFQKNRGT